MKGTSTPPPCRPFFRLPHSCGGGVKETKVSTKEDHEVALLPPADDFYPYDLYLEQFGDPKSKENKKRGHAVSVVNGVRGVLIPSSHKHWQLQRKIGTTITKEDVHDTGLADEDEVVDPAVAENKFRDLVDEQRVAHKAQCVGMIKAVLEKCVAEDRQVMKATGQSQGSQEKRPVSKRRAPKAKPLPGQSAPCAGQEEEGGGEASQAGRCSGRPEGDDSDTSGVKRRRVGFASDDSSSERARQVGRRKSSGSSAPKAKAKAFKLAQSGPCSGAGAAEPEVVADTGNEAPQKVRGRPQLSLNKTADDQWQAFNKAGEDSLYFGERSYTCLRSINRYITSAKQFMPLTSPHSFDLDLALKKLQIIESAIKMVSKWMSRKALQPAAREFHQSWLTLQVFCIAEPALPLESRYLWDLYLQGRSCLPEGDALRDLTVIAERDIWLPSEKTVVQHKYLEQVVASELTRHGSQPGPEVVPSAAERLLRMFKPLSVHGPAILEQALLDEVGELLIVLEPAEHKMKDVEDILGVVGAETSNRDASRLLFLLKKFPALGTPILEAATLTECSP